MSSCESFCLGVCAACLVVGQDVYVQVAPCIIPGTNFAHIQQTFHDASLTSGYVSREGGKGGREAREGGRKAREGGREGVKGDGGEGDDGLSAGEVKRLWTQLPRRGKESIEILVRFL